MNHDNRYDLISRSELRRRLMIWLEKLRAAGECGGCEVELMQNVVRMLDSQESMGTESTRHGECSYCNAEVYIKVKRYLMPVLAPLTREQELRDELVNITGETYAVLHTRFCPMCGKKIYGGADANS